MTIPDAELVKPPQSRRGQGLSWVTVEPAVDWQAGPGRVFVKHQQGYWCRPIWRLFRRTPLLLRELRGLRACQRMSVRVPEIVDYQDDGLCSTLILAEVSNSQPLDEALARHDADREAIISHVAQLIGGLHRAGWSHGALYPQHLLISRDDDRSVTLIDLEKARRNPFKRGADLARFWRHAPALSESEKAQFASHYQLARRSR